MAENRPRIIENLMVTDKKKQVTGSVRKVFLISINSLA
jgi:hypothetical protein